MLVWLVTPRGLYVADPNYPAGLAATRVIPFDAMSGKFGTYSSGSNALAVAQGDEVSYVNFVYKAKSAMVDWPALAADWAAFDAGTIGNGVFPDYEILVFDVARRVWTELTDGYRADRATVDVFIVGPPDADYTGATAKRGTTTIGSGGGSRLGTNRSFRIGLNPGDNDIGFVIYFSQQDWVRTVNTPAPSHEVRDWLYVDFARLTVTSVAASPSPAQPVGVAVRMDIAGSFVRDTHLADLKVQATGPRTFGKAASETRIKDLAGEIAADGKSVTLTITYLDDPTGPDLASCPNVTILRNIPLISTDPTTKTQTFAVAGWDAIVATIQDSYPYFDRLRTALCMTTADWSFNQDANPNPAVYVTLGY
jgi:hypothetical protein